jgi:rhodanese-related sulfurtransferase
MKQMKLRISVDEVINRLKTEDVLLLDVRQPDSYNGSKMKITDSVRVDPNDPAALEALLAGLDKAKPVVAYCT